MFDGELFDLVVGMSEPLQTQHVEVALDDRLEPLGQVLGDDDLVSEDEMVRCVAPQRLGCQPIPAIGDQGEKDELVTKSLPGITGPAPPWSSAESSTAPGVSPDSRRNPGGRSWAS